MNDRPLPFGGRTALITGAAKRLGKAIALRLAANGADVVIHYRSSESDARATAGEVRELGRRSACVQGDLAEPGQADQVWTRAVESLGPIDILVNNASTYQPSSVLDFAPEDLAENMRVHAMAPLQLARALAGQDLPRADVVNMLDARVAGPDPKHAAYHLAKRTLLTLTRMLAVELAPAVRVNAVAPGLILPPPDHGPEYVERLKHTNYLNDAGTPEEVADAVVFLAGRQFVTGQVLYIDGGRSLKGRLYE